MVFNNYSLKNIGSSVIRFFITAHNTFGKCINYHKTIVQSIKRSQDKDVGLGIQSDGSILVYCAPLLF